MKRAALAAVLLCCAAFFLATGAFAQGNDTGPWVKTCTHPDACQIVAVAGQGRDAVMGLYILTEEISGDRGPIVYASLVTWGPGGPVARAGDFVLFDGETECAVNEAGQCILEVKMDGRAFDRMLAAEAIVVDDGTFSASFPTAGLAAAYRGPALSETEAEARTIETMVEASLVAPPVAHFANDDPAAFAAGIRFHSSLPVTDRRLLLEDLAYLAELGPLREGELLAAMIGVPANELTGLALATWIIQSVPVISGSDFCHVDALFAPDADGELAPVEVEDLSGCSERSKWRAFTSTYPPASQRAVILVNGEFAAAPSWQSGLRVLTIVEMPHGRDPASRIRRLDLLVHESLHSRLLAGHIACADESRLVATVNIHLGDFAIPSSPECDPADAGYRAAYAAGAEVNRVLLAHCEACTHDERMQLAFEEMGSWSLVSMATSRTLTIPDKGILAGTGFAGRSFDVAPPLRFFEAARTGIAAGLEDCEACGAEWLNMLEDAGERLDGVEAFLRDNADALPPNWAEPSIDDPVEAPPLDPEAAKDWLAAALEAEGTGHNVPLATQIPCAELSTRCGEILAAYRGVPIAGSLAPWTGDPIAEALFRDGRARLEGVDAAGAKFSTAERGVLDTVVEALLVNSDWRIVIEADGGTRVAERVSRYLISRGIDGGRLTTAAADPSGADLSGSDPSGGKTGSGGQDEGVDIRLDFSGLDLTGLEPQAGAFVDWWANDRQAGSRPVRFRATASSGASIVPPQDLRGKTSRVRNLVVRRLLPAPPAPDGRSSRTSWR